MAGSYPGQPLAVAAASGLLPVTLGFSAKAAGRSPCSLRRHVDSGWREEDREGEQRRPSPWEVGSEGLTQGRCGSQLAEVAEGPSGSLFT